LLPTLQDFLRRSKCAIHEFSLATFDARMAEFVGVLRLMPQLRVLRLAAVSYCEQEKILHKLARREPDGHPALTPRLCQLTIDESALD
ncbi:hypothetical protein HDZ31DRAFT_51532, partial [Schizophyllum fasciatum]